MTTAMKAGEKDRVGALRLVLSELQKAHKEGSSDELAVLRRERKRRLEAAEQFRDGGRPELAEREEAEARLIETYLPAELDDAELEAIVQAAIAETGAREPKDLWILPGFGHAERATDDKLVDRIAAWISAAVTEPAAPAEHEQTAS